MIGAVLAPKEVAAGLKIHPRTLRAWSRRHGIKPSWTAHACHRWTEGDLERLRAAIAKLNAAKGGKR